MRTVDFAPNLLLHGVDLERDPIRLEQLLLHICTVNQRAIRNDRHRVGKFFQFPDEPAEVDIQGRFTVRHQRQVINGCAGLKAGRDFLLNLADDLLDWIKSSSFNGHAAGGTNLAIHTGITAVFGWDVVDAQTAAQATGGDGTKYECHGSFNHPWKGR